MILYKENTRKKTSIIRIKKSINTYKQLFFVDTNLIQDINRITYKNSSHSIIISIEIARIYGTQNIRYTTYPIVMDILLLLIYMFLTKHQFFLWQRADRKKINVDYVMNGS